MRKLITVLAVAALMVPAMAMAASGPIDAGSRVSAGEITLAAASDPMVRTVTVPINLDNNPELAAIDMPLNYGQPGDQIELVDVTFTSRVDYFDMKITNIDNDNKNVVIGLIAMATDPNTPDLKSGNGPIAYLHFQVSDPTMDQFTLRATTLKNPSHRLILVSHEFSSGQPEIVWEEPTFNTTVDLAGVKAALPTSYSLEQNYPNPFNAGTVIKFNVKQNETGDPTNVKLVVYNVLGQAVTTLINEPYAPGSYEVAWDGTSNRGDVVASGVYFYRMVAGDYTNTKKLTLLK